MRDAEEVALHLALAVGDDGGEARLQFLHDNAGVNAVGGKHCGCGGSGTGSVEEFEAERRLETIERSRNCRSADAQVSRRLADAAKFRNDKEVERAKKMGIPDVNKVFGIEEMAKGNVIFAATGVTSGDFLRGIRFFKGGAQTHSVVMRSKSHTIRYIDSRHSFEYKPGDAA